MMPLFHSGLYRSFGIGFVLGAIAVCAVFGGGAGSVPGGGVVPSAIAAPHR